MITARKHGQHITLESTPPHRHADDVTTERDGAAFGYREFYLTDTLRAWDRVSQAYSLWFALDQDEVEALAAVGVAANWTADDDDIDGFDGADDDATCRRE